jgi:hypothetical protein
MGLYQAVIKKQSEEMHANFPFETPEVRAADPETRLRWLVQNMLNRVLAPSDARLKVCLREFVEPTEALDFLVKEIVAEQFGIMQSVVVAVLGREPARDELHRFTISVASQCFYYGLAEPLLARLGVKLPQTPEDVEELAAHISRFSLAGLRAGA